MWLCHPSCIDLSRPLLGLGTYQWTLAHLALRRVDVCSLCTNGLLWAWLGSSKLGLLRYNLFTYGLWKDKLLQISSDHMYFTTHKIRLPTKPLPPHALCQLKINQILSPYQSMFLTLKWPRPMGLRYRWLFFWSGNSKIRNTYSKHYDQIFVPGCEW